MPFEASFEDFRTRAEAAKILIVGDVMLDRYWFGDVERISPEAPVPVVKIEHMEERLGGAANVARNAATLGAQVTLLSVVGADEPARAIERLLGAEKIQARLRCDTKLPTTVKLRVIGRRQQLLRIDFETKPSREVLADSLADYQASLPSFDLVVLSDYGKGGLAHIATMIADARRAERPVLVDPKGEDYSLYGGATILTPNRAEFRQVAGSWKTEDELTRKAQSLRTDLDLEALLVTRSEEGMTLYRKQGVQHIAAQAREVFDVSGAGDTVIATLAVMLAAGADMAAATAVANRAAGIVVGKLGTAVVTPDELVAAETP